MSLFWVLGKVSRAGTLDSVDSAVSLVQMLFLYFRILGKVIPKVQPSPDAGGSATRWAQEWVGLLAVEMYHFKVFWKRKHPLSGKHRQVYCSYFSTWVLSCVLGWMMATKEPPPPQPQNVMLLKTRVSENVIQVKILRRGHLEMLVLKETKGEDTEWRTCGVEEDRCYQKPGNLGYPRAGANKGRFFL